MVEERKYHGWKPWEWAVAGLIGLGSGIVGAATRTYSLFHQKALNYPGFKPLYQGKDEVGAEGHLTPDGRRVSHERFLSEETERAIADRKAATTDADRAAITDRWIKGQHNSKVAFGDTLDKKLLKDLGIENYSFKGLRQRWGTFGEHRRASVRWAASGAAVVGVGATLSFLNNYHTRKKIDELADKLGARDPEGRSI